MTEQKRLHTLFTDADSRRQRIREHIMEGIEDTFPLDGKHFRIELEKFHVKPEKFSPSQQKKALLEKQTMVEPLKATLKLIDKETGEVVQTSKRTLAHVPYLTERHTFIMSGNEYSVSNQVRIKPGVYTRERGNGELEASFNLARGKNFRLMMDPERGIIFMQYASSKIPLYPVLRALGIPNSRIENKWGQELARLNQNFSAGKEDKYLRKLYDKAIPHYNREASPDRETIVKAIKDTYEQTRMDPSVNSLTLGESHDKVNAPALLRASQKLVRVYNGQERQDDRDSLAFKTLHTAESFMKERIEKDAAKDLRRKSIRKLNQKKRDPSIGDMLPTSPFTKSIHRFLKTSALANTPMQINPIEMLDSATKVTALGEGGISSTLAVPDEARDVHHSHLGFMDPIRTPESQKAGIDIRGSLHLARDDDGNMYTPVINTKTGKGEYVSAAKLMRSNVAFPGQDLKLRKRQKKTVDIIDGTGQVRAVNPDDVEYQVPYAASMYSPSTNLVPMLNNAMGNRNIMGSKFQTQAVPLLEREEPLVQVESWKSGRSVEQEFGEMISPVALEDGVIDDIDEDFIYLRPDRQKRASYELHTPKPTAVIVKGNPRFIQNNPRAQRYYDEIKKYLEQKGFEVKMDAGEPYTQPEDALLWIGHSRGVDRLRFAPPMTRTLAFGSLVDGAVNHPVDAQKLEEFDPEEGHEYDPPDEHYIFTPEQKAAIDRVTSTVKVAARTQVEVEGDDRIKIPSSAQRFNVTQFVDTENDDGPVRRFDIHHDGENIAYAAVKEDLPEEDCPWVDGIYVRPEHRGKGLASRLMHEVEKTYPGKKLKLRARPYKNSDRTQEDLVSMYENWGFEPYDTEGRMQKTAARTQVEVEGDDRIKIPYSTNFPMASKTYLHDEINVKKGQRVKKGDSLGENNFTRGNKLALGTNLNVAYVPYYGKNSNDAVVISERAAKKLTSTHMYTESISIDHMTVLDKEKHKNYFGTKYTRNQYTRLDKRGIIRQGQKVEHGELLIAALRENQARADAQLLGKLHRSLVKPYRDAAVVWEHHFTGIVTDVAVTDKTVTVSVKTDEPMQVGDKLCFDEKTEILTDTGWKNVADVSIKDRVCTLQDENQIEYRNPTAVHSYEKGGRMYKIEAQQLDFLVTDNHRMYVQKRDRDHYELVPAKDIFGKRVRYKKDGNWTGSSPTQITLPELAIKGGQGGVGTTWMPPKTFSAKQYLTLLGAFLSDGNLVCHEPSGTYGIDICQVKEPHRQDFIDELEDMGISYCVGGDKLRIHSKQLYEHWKHLGGAYEKHIPNDIFKFKQEDLKILFKWLMWGDGYTNDRPVAYYTVSKRLADDVQRLCLHIGKAANIVKNTQDVEVNGYFYKDHVTYRVGIINSKTTPQVNHGHVHTQKAQTEEFIENYDQPVYCITVPGHVLYTRRNGKPAWSGNSNRFGGKGVVSEIVPDDKMMKDENGEVVDVALTSAGIITRTNPNQILETAVAKVAKKTGKPIMVPQYVKDGDENDRVKWAKDLLKKHNLKDKETLFDPISNKKIPNIMVGPQYTFKMFKSADTNYAARGVGPGYDANMQPTKGGDEGAKSVGKMEFNALVAHNARNVLSEVSNVKSQRNDEFWRRVQLGLPTQTPSENFAFNKFKDTLIGAGINMKKDGTKWSLGPLTDRDVDRVASGTVKNPLLVKTQATKDGQKIVTEKGGLFDPVITGGMTGTKYSKIDLAEPVVNPIFEEPVRRLLGLSQREFKRLRDEEGADSIKRKLNALNLDKKLQEMRQVAKQRTGSARNDALKQIKYIQALQRENLSAGDAYVLTKVPVTPPTVRPIMPNPDGTTLVSDSNYLYRDLMLANQTIEDTPDELKDFDFQKSQRQHLHDAVGALFGVNDPVSPQNKGRGVKGHLQQITGISSPKSGYFQSRMMKKRQDLSGRATIAPDHTLGMDEVGIPNDMAWKMYEPFLIKELIRKGHSAVRAREMVQDRTPAAQRILDIEVKKRPVMINRAPTLHRYNMISAYPKLVPGKTLRLNPFAEAGMNADYDGDALQVHTPVSDAAVREAQGMTLSNLVFGDRSKDDLMIFPAHEAIIGTYLATKDKSNKAPKKFKSKADAMKAYQDGTLKMSDPVEIEGFGK